MGKDKPDLVTAYRKYFRAVEARTEDQVSEAQRIRYEVYCREFQFEDKSRYPDGREQDEFDPRSTHCLLQHRPSGAYEGCVRLVLAAPEDPGAPFPFEKHSGSALRRDVVDPAQLDRSRVGEISRLAVRSAFRRRRGDSNNKQGVSSLDEDDAPARRERRSLPSIALELYLAGACIGMRTGLSGVFAMMEPLLARHLRFYGIRFRQVGDTIDHRGLRAAYYIDREQLLCGMDRNLRELLDAIGEDLERSA